MARILVSIPCFALACSLALAGASTAWAEEGATAAADKTGADAKSEDQEKVSEYKERKYVPSGTLSLSAKTLTVGVGFTWGKGTLTFQDEEYHFKVSGLDLVGVGFTELEATGTVFNLKRIEDFAGTYAGVSAGAALFQGKGGLSVRKGDVYITLKTKQTGATLQTGGGGLTISLVE